MNCILNGLTNIYLDDITIFTLVIQTAVRFALTEFGESFVTEYTILETTYIFDILSVAFVSR